MRIDRTPIVPNRVRTTKGLKGFAFIPNRFLQDGFFVSLTHDELGLYFFLVLAADRHGVSFYSYDKICRLLMIDVDAYIAARNGLIQKDLLAFDGARFQVLALPAVPIIQSPAPLFTHDARLEHEDPARIHVLAMESFGRKPDH